MKSSGMNAYRCDSETATCWSYGLKRGNFNMTPAELSKMVEDQTFLKMYAIVEKKTPFYKLMFDIDLKPDKGYSSAIEGQEEEIGDHVVSKIDAIVNATIGDVDLSYVYCDKSSGHGIHLYYPEVIVDEKLHGYLLDQANAECRKDNPFDLGDHWDKIIDELMAKGMALRLPYFYKDGSYYKVNASRSTYTVPEDMTEQIELCMVRSDATQYNCMVKVDIDQLVPTETSDKKKKSKGKAKKSASTSSVSPSQTAPPIPATVPTPPSEDDHLDLGDRSELCKALLQILSLKRIDDRASWLKIVFLCKTYGLESEAHEVSKKSSKYDAKAIKTIQQVLAGKIPEERITMGSLMKWASDDNPEEFNKIMARDNERRDRTYKLQNQGELGHSELFFDHYREIVKVVKNNGDAYIFDDETKLWKERCSKAFYYEVSTFLRKTILAEIEVLSRRGAKIDDKEKAKMITEKIGGLHAILKATQKTQHSKNVWELVSSRFLDPTFVTRCNSTKDLLPIRGNKVINLKDGTTSDRRRDHYFTFECDVDYLDGPLPNATKFFGEIMNKDRETIDYLQQCLGYCITGEVTSRCLFIFWGNGANGKSTVNELLSKVLGPLHTSTTKKVFIATDDTGGASPHLMQLIGKRVCSFSETKANEKLNENLIKALTGYDIMSARPLYGSIVQFTPICKPILLTNHKPIFDVDDKAMLDRLRYVPFNARFVDDPKKGEFKKDTDSVNKLVTEHLSEVFSWIVRGAVKWYQSGGKLTPPKAVVNATNDYLNEIDTINQFLQDQCRKNNMDKVERGALYARYVTWTNDNGTACEIKSKFYKSVEGKGYVLAKISGNRYFKGIRLS